MSQPEAAAPAGGGPGTRQRRTGLIEFQPRDFDLACAELFRRAAAEERPDLLIGIPTGGMFVARSMAASAGGVAVLPLTCRRASSRSGLRNMLVRGVAATLPRPLLDRLRMIEHAILTARRGRPAEPPPVRFDDTELAALRRWFAAAGDAPSVLIVDDAVDSGATLARVLQAVQQLAPPAARLRSAVIALTTERPLACPTYALHQGRLCRFPWSLDARPSGPC